MSRWLFAQGHVADLVVAFTLLEAAALAVWRRRALIALAPTLVSGIGLALAVRAALTAAAPVWIALALLLALVAHVTDLTRRL